MLDVSHYWMYTMTVVNGEVVTFLTESIVIVYGGMLFPFKRESRR